MSVAWVANSFLSSASLTPKSYVRVYELNLITLFIMHHSLTLVMSASLVAISLSFLVIPDKSKLRTRGRLVATAHL